MSCRPCQAHQERAQRGQPSGAYHLACVRCCARLVRSARPLRAAQEAMLAAIAMRPGRPSRQQVLAAIHQLDQEA